MYVYKIKEASQKGNEPVGYLSRPGHRPRLNDIIGPRSMAKSTFIGAETDRN